MKYMIFAIMAAFLALTGCSFPPPSPISGVDASIGAGGRIHAESSFLDALTSEYVVNFKSLPTGVTVTCNLSTEGQRMTNGKGEVKFHVPKKYNVFTISFQLDGKPQSFSIKNYRLINDFRWENGQFVDEYIEFYKNLKD